MHTDHIMPSITVSLDGGKLATLECTAPVAWLVTHNGRELFNYTPNEREQYALDDALADAIYAAESWAI